MKFVSFLFTFVFLSSLAFAQDVVMVNGPTKKVGKYAVMLRLPEGGLVAEEEQQLEIRVTDTSREDAVLGAAPIIRAVVQSTVSMPSMPSMPTVEEVAHTEGVPGDYGIHPTFAHGGDYVLFLKIAPPGGEPFSVDFPLTVADLSDVPNRKATVKPYRVELKTEPGKVKAGEPAKLRLTVWANLEKRDAEGRPTGKRETVQIKKFDVAHEKLLHLIMVRKDLGFYAHEHPELQPDGTFVLSSFAFPTAGEYRIFADTAPKGAGSQVLWATLKVEGKTKAEPKPLSAAAATMEQKVDGTHVVRKDPSPIPPRKTTLLTFTLREIESGKPVTDLEPYLGALGHLVMINEDAQTYVHSHPDERDERNGKHGELTFLVRPSKAGLYRGWFEFQRKGKLSRAEFVFTVKE